MRRAYEGEGRAVIIHPLDAADIGYCLSSWWTSHKEVMRIKPWDVYKAAYGPIFRKIVEDPSTVLLGAYENDRLLGWLAMTPGKRVDTVHWAYTKHALDGERTRRRGVMTALLDEADLGSSFVYTLRPRRKLDEALVAALKARGVTAVFVPLKEYLK